MQNFEPLRPNSERGQAAVIILIVELAVIFFIGLFPTFLFYSVLKGDDLFNVPVQTAALISVVSVSIIALVNIISIILIIRWMRRAYFNLHSLGITELQHSEGWAAGAWFVPFLNLVWPYQIMREIWVFTQAWYQPDPINYPRKEAHIVGWWWGVHILGIFLSVLARLTSKGDDATTSLLFAIMGMVVTLAEAVLLILIIRQVIVMEKDLVLRAQQYSVYAAQQMQVMPPMQLDNHTDARNSTLSSGE